MPFTNFAVAKNVTHLHEFVDQLHTAVIIPRQVVAIREVEGTRDVLLKLAHTIMAKHAIYNIVVMIGNAKIIHLDRLSNTLDTPYLRDHDTSLQYRTDIL